MAMAAPRPRLWLLLLGICGCLSTSSSAGAAEQDEGGAAPPTPPLPPPPARRNVLLMISDDLRPELSVYVMTCGPLAATVEGPPVGGWWVAGGASTAGA